MSGPYDQQVLAQGAGRSAGQTVTQTTSIHRSAEVVQAQAPLQQQQSPSRGDRQRLQRSGSSTSLSSSSSTRIQKASAVGSSAAQAMSGGYQQQYLGGNNFAYGAPTGAQYGGANGAQYGGATGASYGGPTSFSYSGQTGSAYGAQAGPAYGQSSASFTSIATGPRRQGRVQRQVIRLPEQGAGQVRQVRHRLLTPEPDTLERVYIQRAGNEVIEEITEIPTTPPPRVQERTVVEPAGPPQVIKRVIRVPPRGGSYGGYPQQSAGVPGGNFQASSNLLSAGSYGNVQQAAGSYQQFAAPAPAFAAPAYAASSSFSGGYGSNAGGYGGSYGGGYQGQQAGGYGGYSSQSVRPPIGCHPAFCFQV